MISLPQYDSSEGVTAIRNGRLVQLWVSRHGESWRDPALAERAVAAWHLEEAKRTMDRVTTRWKGRAA